MSASFASVAASCQVSVGDLRTNVGDIEQENQGNAHKRAKTQSLAGLGPSPNVPSDIAPQVRAPSAPDVRDHNVHDQVESGAIAPTQQLQTKQLIFDVGPIVDDEPQPSPPQPSPKPVEPTFEH
eukprot:349324-Karenia_brevis.AAC.1